MRGTSERIIASEKTDFMDPLSMRRTLCGLLRFKKWDGGGCLWHDIRNMSLSAGKGPELLHVIVCVLWWRGKPSL